MASSPPVNLSRFGLTGGAERSPASKADPLGMSSTSEVLQTITRPDKSTYAPGNPPPDVALLRTRGLVGPRDPISPGGRSEVGGAI